MGRSSALPPVPHIRPREDFILLFLIVTFAPTTFSGADRGDRLQGAAGLHRRGRHHGAQLPLL